MTDWAHGVSGNFNVGTNWSGGAVPGGSSVDADLSPSGTYTVTVNIADVINTVLGVETSPDATLDLVEGTFIALNGTDTGDNDGTILIGNNTVFEIGGASGAGPIPVGDIGKIELESTGSPTILFLNGSTVADSTIELTGGGNLTLSNNINNLIENAAGTILDNENDTISGAGTIDIAELVNEFVVAGVFGLINADETNPLILEIPAVTNLGTMKATSTGGLTLLDISNFNNGTGTVEATTAGSVIHFDDTQLSSGTLSTVAGSSIVITSFFDNTIDPATLTNAGDLEVDDSAELIFGSSNPIDNSGTIALNAALGQAILELDGLVTLQGKGKVTLTDNPGNVIESNGSAATLTNVNNTISGAGTIGDSKTILDNEGTIDGTGKNPLMIVSYFLLGGTNTGTIESSSTGGVKLSNIVLTNTGGLVEAAASGSHIDLDGAAIEGGTVKTVAGSTIDAVAGTGQQFSPATFDNAGTFLLNNQSYIYLASNVDNTGSIVIENNGTGETELEISSNVTLTGTGKLTLSGLNSWLDSNQSGPVTLTNDGNTISGSGDIGDNDLTLDNEAGVIDANNPLLAMSINTLGNTITNGTTIEATAGATLYVSSQITNAGKLIADNGTVVLYDAVTGITGSLVIEGSGDMNLGAAGVTQNLTFASGATGTLTLSAAATPTPTSEYDGTISGFGTSDAIDLAGLPYVADSTYLSSIPMFNSGPDTTTLTVNNGTDSIQLTFAGNLSSHIFAVGEDANGDTLITDPVSKSATGGSSVANVALLGSYMAAAFASAAVGQASAATAESQQTAAVHLAVAHA